MLANNSASYDIVLSHSVCAQEIFTLERWIAAAANKRRPSIEDTPICSGKRPLTLRTLLTATEAVNVWRNRKKAQCAQFTPRLTFVFTQIAAGAGTCVCVWGKLLGKRSFRSASRGLDFEKLRSVVRFECVWRKRHLCCTYRAICNHTLPRFVKGMQCIPSNLPVWEGKLFIFIDTKTQIVYFSRSSDTQDAVWHLVWTNISRFQTIQVSSKKLATTS